MISHLTAAPPGWPFGSVPPLALIALLFLPVLGAYLRGVRVLPPDTNDSE